MRGGAFTLLEVIAVIVLLGLLTGATAWVLTDNARQSSRQNVVGRITHADRMARLAARRLDEACVLRFDLEEQSIRRLAGRYERRRTMHSMEIPDGCRISRIIVPRNPRAAGGFTRTTAWSRTDSGVVDIPFSAGGQSISYAVRLTCENRDGWLVFCGLTGQVTRIHDEQEVNNLFAMLETGRTDAR